MTSNNIEQITFPEPDDVLTEKPSLHKYLRYLLFFGPGAVLASMTIGQGQLILGPQIGAWAGFTLLWLITLNIGSYIIAYVGCRFTMLSGISLMDMFSYKTRKGWLNWLFIGLILIFIPMFTASIITTLGQSLAWIFGFGNYLIWGVSICLLAGILVIVARYRFLELVQAFFVVVLGAGAIICVILIKPDILEMLPNFFLIGNVPEYPSWVVTGFPKVASTPVPFIMLGYLGTLAVTLIPLVSYLGWVKVKRWGVFKDKENPDVFSQKLFDHFKKTGKITYLPSSSSEVKKSRILLKPILVDLGIAFAVVSVVSAAYVAAGKYLLGLQPDGSYLLPSNIDLISTQAVIFTKIAFWLKPLYQISVFFALFGTVYAGFEAVSRMLYETSKNVIIRIKDVRYKRFMGYLMLYILGVGLPLSLLIYNGFSVILMLSITLLFIGVVAVIIYGIGAIYISQKVLPERYRLGRAGLVMSILAVIFMAIPILFLFI